METQKFIVIQFDSPIIEKLRYEYANLGICLYYSIAEMIIKSKDYRLQLIDTNIGIIACKVNLLNFDDLLEILDFCVHQLGVYDEKLYDENWLYCPSLMDAYAQLNLY